MEEVHEPLKSTKKSFIPDDYVVNPVTTIVGDQQDLNPPPFSTQEGNYLPSCEPSHHIKITGSVTAITPMVEPHSIE
ncbi:hypothetical protein A2U01_0026910 [Trifolium medium]|uniref:Uncharacterized protein n=1 Tax=Trifolium medium TaxID=97028 RepID=A0A392P3E4_9FABA|nr:hypothetical protein [Trifolium medium]